MLANIDIISLPNILDVYKTTIKVIVKLVNSLKF